MKYVLVLLLGALCGVVALAAHEARTMKQWHESEHDEAGA